jgi:hypothetical protein
MAERMVDRYIDTDINGSSKYQFHSSAHLPTSGPSELMEDGLVMDARGIGPGGIFTDYTPAELGMDTHNTPFQRKDAESVTISMPGGPGIIPVSSSPYDATYEQQSTEIAYQDGTVTGGPGIYEPGGTLAAEDQYQAGKRLMASTRSFLSSDVGMVIIAGAVIYGIYSFGRRSGSGASV